MKELFEKWAEYSQSAVDTVLRYDTLGREAAAKIARQQLEAFGDYATLASEQLKAVSRAKGLQELYAAQAELLGAYADKARSHAERLLEIAIETQEEAAALAGEAVRRTVSEAREGARKVVAQIEQNVTAATKASKKAA